jgi:hypothetical protein
MAAYMEKAEKAEFKGQQKKALEQYYEALYYLKHNEVDDVLKAEHIAGLEQKIRSLDGMLNYEPSSDPSAPTTLPT